MKAPIHICVYNHRSLNSNHSLDFNRHVSIEVEMLLVVLFLVGFNDRPATGPTIESDRSYVLEPLGSFYVLIRHHAYTMHMSIYFP